jgi:hypothetical protein
MADGTDTEELRERAQLLEQIQQLENDAEWTPIEDLRERADLLESIQKAETEGDRTAIEDLRKRGASIDKIETEWTDIEELLERIELLATIAQHEAKSPKSKAPHGWNKGSGAPLSARAMARKRRRWVVDPEHNVVVSGWGNGGNEFAFDPSDVEEWVVGLITEAVDAGEAEAEERKFLGFSIANDGSSGASRQKPSTNSRRRSGT